jgi:hypothetical protein
MAAHAFALDISNRFNFLCSPNRRTVIQLHKGPYGLGVLYTSLDCSSIRRRQLQGSLLLNGIAAVVFVSSNYAMQGLASPTRAEINSAHSKLQSMDIGRQSLRNLLRVKWSRKLIWLFLEASGIPLHIL